LHGLVQLGVFGLSCGSWMVVSPIDDETPMSTTRLGRERDSMALDCSFA
jgi:hypothetical protein